MKFFFKKNFLVVVVIVVVVVATVLLYDIYIIYISVKCLSHLWSIFLTEKIGSWEGGSSSDSSSSGHCSTVAVTTVLLYNIYIIYVSVKCLSHLWSIFFKKS
jgi:hypothetical protein